METRGYQSRKYGRDISNLLDPSKVPGSSFYSASNGTDLGVQAIFAGSMFIVFITLFSVLRVRWPFIFSPRTRLTITAPPFLSSKFFGWFTATMRTPETHILNTVGLDSVIFLRFYKMCLRLLLDVGFFSLVIIWPINIRWSKVNLDTTAHVSGVDSDGSTIETPASVTDYLFNLTLNTKDPKQKWNLIPHIVFAYIFSGLAYYHISRFSSRWASLRWHFLMCSRHAMVSRTVMLTGVPQHLASSPRELEWFWGPGLNLGKVERVRVCPFNTKLTSGLRERARYLLKLEHAIKAVLGNPCVHKEYDPERLKALILDPSEQARVEADRLLLRWAKPSRKTRVRKPHTATDRSTPGTAAVKIEVSEQLGDRQDYLSSATATAAHFVASCARGVRFADSGEYFHGHQRSSTDSVAVAVDEVQEADAEDETTWVLRRPKLWVKAQKHWWQPWEHVDAIDYWRTRFLTADKAFRDLRRTIGRERTGSELVSRSTTAFVTFEDAASAHMVTQLSCYPNPGYMKAKLAPEPRGVYWPNVWISNRRKWALFTGKWLVIFVIWAFWCAPVILVSTLLTPNTLQKIWPSLDIDKNPILRSLLSTTVPSVFLLLFLNMLPWILKQVHFFTGVRTKPDIDYSVLTKMWAFLVFNVILVFGFSGTFWEQILDLVNNPGTVMQSLATNIPKVGTFFTGYILVLGIGYQPFKLLQLRPVIWHIGRQWLCNTPRDYARLVSPVYIDWYSVYPYPLMVFAIAMIYSTFSPPVVVGAVIYFVIGYPVMKYLLLYVYFHPFETAGMAWPRVCRRMIFSMIIYQVVMLTFVIVKGGGWYTFSMVPLIVLYLWFFYRCGWSLEKQGTTLPVYLWRNPPPNSSYPLPPESSLDQFDTAGEKPLRTSTSHHLGVGSPWSPRTQPLSGNRSGTALRKLNVSVAQRQLAAAGHRRESSRSARTRDIILSRAPRPSPPQPPPPLQYRRRRSASSPANNLPPQILSKKPSSVGIGKQRVQKHKKNQQQKNVRRRRYKSLAEAATTEGSRLLLSLTRLPGELMMQSRNGSGTESMKQKDGQAESKRWSVSLLNPFAKDDSSGASRALLEEEDDDSESSGASPMRPVQQDRLLADNGADIGSATLAKPGSAALPATLPSSSLARPAVMVRTGTRQLAGAGKASKKKPSMLRQEVRIGEQRLAKDGYESDGWSDLDSDGEKPVVAEKEPELDPLEYLQPSTRPTATLGTLLSSVSHHRLADASPSSFLRRRRPYNHTHSDSIYQQGYQSDSEGGEAAREAAGAGGIDVNRARAYADSLAPSEGGGLGTFARGTFQRIRDYFFADFRPARPILDLTYDRLYTQGDEEQEHLLAGTAAGAAAGAVVPPIRGLLERVLPRSMSRTFGSSQPEDARHVRSGSVITRLGENAYLMQGALSPFSESVYQTAPPLAPTMSATPQQPQRMARGSTFASHVRSQSAAVPSPLIRGLSTPISRTSTSPAIGGNDQSLAQAIDGFSQALGGNNSSSVPVAAKTPPTAAEKPASAHKRSRSVHALMGLFTRKQSVAAVAPAISNTDPSMSEPPQFTLPLATPAPAPSAPPRLSREPSSIGSVHSGSIATPKNSLPLPRPALTTRMVSELNYPTRRTVTASVAPYLLPPRADPNGDQLIANYQRFAVEAQSRFAADECTDYSQTPMLNVFGVLDRGIQDYVHPGLVGELPTLWLPNKDLNESSAGDVLGDKQEVEREVERDQAMVEPEFAESAPQWVVNRLLSYRMNPTPGASAGEAQFYPSAADHDEELREVRIHQG